LTILKHPSLGRFDEIAIARPTAARIENDRVCVDQLAFAVSLDHTLHKDSDCSARLMSAYEQLPPPMPGKSERPYWRLADSPL
jgi:hypothetical protein